MSRALAVAVGVIAVCALVSAQTPSFGRELASIDLGQMFGGPLQAAVNAQAQSAMATLQFVQGVGFYPNGTAKAVTFQYPLVNATTGLKQMQSLTVPLLSLLNIPLLKVQEVFISFSAKLNSIARTESTSDSLYKDSVNVESWDRFGTTSTMSASYSDKKSTRSGSTEEREFSLHVTLKARQADMPVGLGRILDILEEANLVK